MAEQFLLSVSLSLIITEGFRARRANIGNSTLQTLHSEGKFLEIKLFLTYFFSKQVLFKICTSIFHMVLNYQQKRSSDFNLNIFVVRVSRHSGCWLLLSVIFNN